MTTPTVEEMIRSLRPSLLPTSDEMVAYERRIIADVTTLIAEREAKVRREIVREIQKIADYTPPNLLLNEIVNKI